MRPSCNGLVFGAISSGNPQKLNGNEFTGAFGLLVALFATHGVIVTATLLELYKVAVYVPLPPPTSIIVISPLYGDESEVLLALTNAEAYKGVGGLISNV